MNPFKVGDLVKYIGEHYDILSKEDTFTIESIKGNKFALDSYKNMFFMYDNFEIVNPFKVGDRVRCIEITGNSWFSSIPDIGEEFIVTCVRDNFIGFVSKHSPHEEIDYSVFVDKGPDYISYPNTKGKNACWYFNSFELVESIADKGNTK